MKELLTHLMFWALVAIVIAFGILLECFRLNLALCKILDIPFKPRFLRQECEIMAATEFLRKAIVRPPPSWDMAY